jgi:hypothetical protein
MGVTDDYLEGLYRTLYESELETSDKLDAQINLPTAVVTGLLAVSAFYIEHFPKIELRPGVVLFITSLVFYGLFLLAATYCLIQSYFKQKYELLPPPEAIDENAVGLRKHYEAVYDNNKDVDESVKLDLQAELINVYKQSGSFNRGTNVTRIAWLHWSTRWIIYSIIALVASRAFYYFGASDTSPQKVEISGLPAVQKIELVSPKGD